MVFIHSYLWPSHSKFNQTIWVLEKLFSSQCRIPELQLCHWSNFELVDLPNIHEVVRGPAEDKSDDEDPGDFYCVDFGFSKHSAVVYFAFLARSGQGLRSSVDDNDDGDVTKDHHKKRQHPRQTKHEYEVEELLFIISLFLKKPIYVLNNQVTPSPLNNGPD